MNSTNAKREIVTFYLFYLSALLVSFVLHQVFVSLIAYFHFELGHGLSELEDWIGVNAALLIIFSKLIAFCLFLRMVNIERSLRSSLQNLFRGYYLNSKRELVIVLIVALIFLTIKLSLWSLPSSPLHLASLLPISVMSSMILLDYFLLLELMSRYKASEKRNYILCLSIIPIHYVSLKYTFPYETTLSLSISLHLGFMLFWAVATHLKNLAPLLFFMTIIAVVLPLIGIFPFDRIAGQSPHALVDMNPSDYFVLYLILFGYIWHNESAKLNLHKER